MSPRRFSATFSASSYEIDPRAQGTVTLATGRPISKKDVLFVLESGLRANNLVMIREGAGYRIAPIADGSPGSMDFGGGQSAQAGYGMSVIPLQYVSGATLAKLLEGFAARPGAIRTDPAGRMLMVVGTGPERQSALETVRSFDVDWLRGQSVGMYPVHNSEPDPIVAELEKIMDSGESGLGHGLVKLQSVSRQNAILVVAAKPELLRATARWIERLDSPEQRELRRHGLQGALRRRQTDCGAAAEHLLGGRRRGCGRRHRAVLGLDHFELDRTPDRRRAQ